MRICYRVILVYSIALAPLLAHQAARAVELTHVHGLAYSADGKTLMVPSHHGLALYREGKWSKAPGPQHDYMGFAATKTQIYSSGHPARGSGLKNPFGLIRSRDSGATWEKLSLEGEADFHLLATGWNTNAVYVWSGHRNSRMPQLGLHYTLNNGFQWKHVAAAGLSGKPRALAVHPTDAKMLAIATPNGVFLSRDWGGSFRPIAGPDAGLSVFFDLDGKHLWHGSYTGTPQLTRTELQTGQSIAVPLPPLTRDAVSYVAQNPANSKEYAIATFERSVFVSRDGGRTWIQIAHRGQGG